MGRHHAKLLNNLENTRKTAKLTQQELSEHAGVSRKSINVNADDVRLLFIRHGVYCDCQVLQSAEPALAEMFAGAA